MKANGRIVTLTLHPAIDRVVKVETLRPGETLDAREFLTVPAGKGVNTARVLSVLRGAQPNILAVVWAGGGEEQFFKTRLHNEAGIECAVCPRKASTRFATTYLEADGRDTHIKEAMPAPTLREAAAFLDFWSKTLRKDDLVALCGSAPGGTKMSFLKRVFSIARERGARAILADTNGTALEAAAQSRLTLLKGNAIEIGGLLNLGEAFDMNKARHRSTLAAFLNRKIAPERILITLGAEGALLASRQDLLHCKNDPRHFTHTIVSTTGCGDAATAGAIWSMLSPEDNEELLLRRAVACGAAKTLSADPGKITLKSARSFVRYCLTKSIDVP